MQLVFFIFLFLSSVARAQAPDPCADCFPLERLSPEDRARSEELLWKALDSEHLYTLAGGLKPMSGGALRLDFEVDKPELGAIEDARRVTRVWICNGEIRATVHHFHTAFQGKRSADLATFHLPSFGRMLRAKAAYFAPFGFTPSMDPMEALMTVEMEQPSIRLRGQGYFFGYPDYAIDFFMQADERQRAGEKLVPRDFYSIPTHSRPERGFVYAVPKGHEERPEDRELKEKAAVILAQYRKLKEKHKQPHLLLREWFNDGAGRCSPSTWKQSLE